MDHHTYKCLCWFIQILTWIFLFLLFLSVFRTDLIQDKDHAFLYVFLSIYILYCYLEFRSDSLRYIKNKGSCQLINQNMGIYFRTYPEINFYCECFHYSHVYRFGRGSRREKVVTHSENYTLPYYSERDVSGLFYLDIGRANVNSKQYIQLELFEEINFADAISYMDYEYQKDMFWRRNRFRDSHFDFEENRIIPGMVRNNLVRLAPNEPCCINTCMYTFFTIIPFCELYKLYFDSFCIYQSFRIRKLVSTRYDLNQQVYQCFIPQLNLISSQYYYNPEDYNFLNNQYKVEVPTAKQLKNASKYQIKVPDYKISSGNGKFHAGVIIDDPNYSSYDKKGPPRAFTLKGCDVVLEKDEINEDGNLPPGFEEFECEITDEEEEEDGDVSKNQFPVKKKIEKDKGIKLNINKPKIEIKNKNNNNESSTAKRQILSNRKKVIKDKKKKTNIKKK